MAFATKYDQVERELAEARAAERKIQLQSLLYSFLVMLVLAALIILWIKIPPQNPPMPDAIGGMEMIEGTDAVGMNDTKESVMAGAPQKTDPTPPAPQQPVAEPPASNDGDVVVKKAPEKPVLETTKPTATQTKPTKVPERKPDPRFSFDNSKTNGNNGPGGTNPSKGTGYTPGNQGTPGGNKDGGWHPGYGPTGDGNGKGAHLGNRKALSLPEPDCNNQKEGRDVVKIVVDNNGRVIEAHGGMRGSAITDVATIQCDEIAAKKAKFNVDANAPAGQEGYMVYIHKLQ